MSTVPFLVSLPVVYSWSLSSSPCLLQASSVNLHVGGHAPCLKSVDCLINLPLENILSEQYTFPNKPAAQFRRRDNPHNLQMRLVSTLETVPSPIVKANVNGGWGFRFCRDTWQLSTLWHISMSLSVSVYVSTSVSESIFIYIFMFCSCS
jgi:hypothetical protein